MAARIQLMVFVASSFFLVMYSIWLVLAWRFAPRWSWLRAFHPAWRYGISAHNALLYGFAAFAAWLIANSALVLLAGVPAGAQMLGITLWVAIATGALIAWSLTYVVVSRGRADSGGRT